MRISTMIRFRPDMAPHDRMLGMAADYARRIEASGFPGIWVGDSLGRGRPTLDPLIELSVLAAVTERVELGICGVAASAAQSDRAGASRAVGAGAVGQPFAARRGQRLERARISNCSATISTIASAS